jgi:hypothetical protein
MKFSFYLIGEIEELKLLVVMLEKDLNLKTVVMNILKYINKMT